MPISSIVDVLQQQGASGNDLTEQQYRQLDEDGYCILSLTPEQRREFGLDVEELKNLVEQQLQIEGPYAGFDGKEEYFDDGKSFEDGSRRLGNLADKHKSFRRLMEVPQILRATQHVIQSDFLVSSINMRDPQPGRRQSLHLDWLPRQAPEDGHTAVFVTLFLDPSHNGRGPLRIVPGTHRMTGWPNDHLDDLQKPHPDERTVEVDAGDIIVFNTNLWHAGTPNPTGLPRRVIFLTFRRRDMPQLLNQKRYISPATMNTLTESEKYLLAVRPEDPTQKELSVGVNAHYRALFGEDR